MEGSSKSQGSRTVAEAKRNSKNGRRNTTGRVLPKKVSDESPPTPPVETPKKRSTLKDLLKAKATPYEPPKPTETMTLVNRLNNSGFEAIGNDEIRVLIFFIAYTHYNGVPPAKVRVARELDMHRKGVNTCVKRLQERGLLSENVKLTDTPGNMVYSIPQCIFAIIDREATEEEKAKYA